MTAPGARGFATKALAALGWIALGCLAQPAAAADSAASDRKLGRNVEITLKLAKDRYTLGEDISMGVAVRNTGAAPVEIPNPFHRDNWQPTYTVTGPGYPKGATFSFRSAVVGDSRPNPADVVPNLVTLAPGRSLEREIPLHQWLPLKEPGSYSISARLDWQGISAAAAPRQITVEALNIKALSLGVDLGVKNSVGYWLEWLHQSGPGTRVFTAVYLPPQRDVRGFAAHTVSPLVEAGAQAEDVLSPWTTYDRQSELVKWRAWREGATLLALAIGDTVPVRLALPQVPSAVVRPALMARSGELDVFVLLARNELALARFFPPKSDGKAEAARIVFRTQTPGNVLAARAAEAPGAGGQRRLVLVSGEGDTTLALLRPEATPPGRAVGSATVAGARPIPGVTPGLRLEADGSARAATLVQMDRGRRRLAMVEVEFGADGRAGAPRLTELMDLERQPQTGTVQYVITPGAAAKPEWAVLLDNGRVLHARSAASGVTLKTQPVLPLEILPTDEGSYLLTTDPRSGPVFTLL